MDFKIQNFCSWKILIRKQEVNLKLGGNICNMCIIKNL